MDKAKLKTWQKWTFRLSGLVIALAVIAAAMLMGDKYAAALLWIILVIILLTWGNRGIHQKLNVIQPWTRYPLRRFFIQLFVSALYSLGCVNVCYYILKTLFLGLPPGSEQLIVLNLYGLLFIIPIVSINFGIYFMIRWKKAFIQSEQLREENIRSRFESLKTHIDPHFLFNNLNALSSLIDKDPQEAHRFLERFADVYRYVLQHRNEELVELETELTFIRSYLFLFQQRLEKQLRITISNLPLDQRFYLPPLSVQMLVENAIKHNKATAENPLSIDISITDNRWLIVRNSFQPKATPVTGLSKTGLENIAKRIAYFSDDVMVVEQDSAYFTVKLPLLEWDKREGDLWALYKDPQPSPKEQKLTDS